MGATSRETVIAVEQKAVDHAYDCYEAKVRELTAMADGKAAGAAASGKDGIAIQIEAAAEAASYRLDGEDLVVMRVDAHERGEPQPETWYIGRRRVVDENRDLVVVPWTNPRAAAWRTAKASKPGEVLLRRRLDCDGRTVLGYRDEITPPAPQMPTTPTADGQESVPGKASTAAPPISHADCDHPATRAARAACRKVRRATGEPLPDTTVSLDTSAEEAPEDAFLLRELNRSRRGRMRDIVETIQPDQMALVADSPADVLVIQGGPGTGKSAVGLHRVTWLVDNRHFRAQDILVVGPHRRFLDYVARVLPTLGTRDVTAVEVGRLWEGEVRGTDSPETRRVKSDERMAEVLRRRVKGSCRTDAVDTLVTAPSSAGDEPAFTVILGSAPLRVPRSEIAALLEQARGGPGHYRARRDRFRDLVVDRLLVALSKGFPHRARERTARRSIERNRLVTALVERTWPRLSPEEALRGLLNSPSRLAECAAGVLSEEEQALLRRPAADSAAEEPWTLDDLVCLEELRHLIAGETPQRYPHIVVDEAQDLTPMQARSLRRRCPTSSMTVLGDLAQATGPHGYPDWERLGAILAGDGGWHLAELNTSYRVPAQIMEYIAPLARAVAPSVPFPAAVKESEGEAVRVVATTPWQLLDEAVAHAARLAGSDGHSQRSIAVVVPDDSGWLQRVRELVNGARDMSEEVREAVSVLAAAQAKGMEFDHVLVLEPSTIADRGPEGPRQLYVALTRSTQTLTILHTSPLPEVMRPKREQGTDGLDGAAVAANASGEDTRAAALQDAEPEQFAPVPPEDAGTPCTGERANSAVPNGYTRTPAAETHACEPTAPHAEHPTADDPSKHPLFAALVSAASEDRDCNTHESVRHHLMATLFAAGLRPQDSSLVDVLSCPGTGGAVLYEVLRAEHTTYPEIRAGAVRLREIDHVSGACAARLFVVLPDAPTQDWAPDVVRAALGVRILWRTATGWAGPDSAWAFGAATGG